MKTEGISTEVNHIISNTFQPCDISEILQLVDNNRYQFMFPGQYSVCDPDSGDTSMGAGTPTISHGKYLENMHHIYGIPKNAVKANEIFYAVFFPNGLQVMMEGKEIYPTMRQRMELGQKLAGWPLDELFDKDDPIWDEVPKPREYSHLMYQTDSSKIVCFRKDTISKEGKIIREPARPFQLSVNAYA